MFSYGVLLFIYVFTICHYSLCVRAFMIKVTVDGEEAFFEHFKGWDLNGLYIDAFYYATETLVGVGYGDVFPVGNQEIYFVAVCMFFGPSIYAYARGKIQIKLKEVE